MREIAAKATVPVTSPSVDGPPPRSEGATTPTEPEKDYTLGIYQSIGWTISDTQLPLAFNIWLYLVSLSFIVLTARPTHTGFREFDAYLSSFPSITVPSGSSFENFTQLLPEQSKAFTTAVEEMKLSTRKYAKRQVSWIRNKLLPAIYAAAPNSISSADHVDKDTDTGERVAGTEAGTRERDVEMRAYVLDATGMNTIQ